VDLDGLARLFATPGLSGKFAPSSFFCGVSLVWEPVTPMPAEVPPHRVFAAAEELCANAALVGVALNAYSHIAIRSRSVVSRGLSGR
jgi:hypothetical protein